MIALSTSPFSIGRLRRKTVWYSVKDGNWNDPTIWMSNSLNKESVTYSNQVPSYPQTTTQKITYPSPGDDVIVGHNVTYNLGVFNITYALDNVFVTSNGTLKIASANNFGFFQINGCFQCDGTLDLSTAGSSLYLSGSYNRVINATIATTSTIVYNGITDQDILPLSYGNLTITSPANGTINTQWLLPTRYIRANLTITNNLSIDSSNMELGNYNLTVNGTTNLSGSGGINKSGTGSVLFIGTFNGAAAGNYNRMDFSGGNPTVEFRGGFTIPYYTNGNGTYFKTGTGQWNFTTNNQMINAVYSTIYSWNCLVLISGAITVTVTGNNSPLLFNNIVNGDNISSTLNTGSTGAVYLGTSTLPMSTGIFNYAYGGSTSILGFVFNGDFTLPFSSYPTLLISGTGTKSLSVDTTITGNLQFSNAIADDGIIDFAGYSCSVSGSCTFGGNTTMKKTAIGGSLLFIGLVDFLTQGGASAGIDFSGGNPTVEFRGGLNAPYGGTMQIKSGTGTWKFTTNSQTLNASWSTNQSIDAPIVISGAITVILTSEAATGNWTFNNTVNGDNANSVLDCRIGKSTSSGVVFNNATAPMLTGKLYANQLTNNQVYYSYAGNQDIAVPSDSIPGYQNLTLKGSGTKRLLGNVSVKGTYTLASPTTLNTNGFTLTNP